MKHSIPQMFSLRKVIIKGNKRSGRNTVTLYIYCNYRGTNRGTVDVSDPKIKGDLREYAKRVITERHNDADFWR